MKIVHIGDCHLGKVVNEYSMIEDQKYFLDKIVEFLKDEMPDTLIIAGDIYDRSVPPAEAVELLDDFLNKIVLELNIPVLAISGNHDSGARLSFGNKMLKNKGLYIEGILTEDIQKVVLKDEFGNVNFYLVPFCDPAEMRLVFKNEEIKTFNDGMRVIVSKIEKDMNKSERNILVTHGYVTYSLEDTENRGGLQILPNERPLSIGGTDLIDARNFDSFNYVALGHLHGPQRVGSDRIRYSGSLLKYSVDEWNQHKSIPLVNLNESGDVNVELREIKPLRDLRKIRGPLKDLIDRNKSGDFSLEDYVFAEIEDEGEVLDAISKLRAVFPNIMGMRRVGTSENSDIESGTSASGNFREKSVEELFSDFYLDMQKKDMDEQRKKVFREILEEALKEER